MFGSHHTSIGEAPVRRLIAVALALVLIATACSSDSETINLGEDALSPGVEAGSVDTEASGTAMNFSYKNFDDVRVRLDDLPEGPVVVNFFASWCTSCIAEMPDFETVSQNLADDVTFLGLAVNDRVSDSARLVDETGVTYPVGSDQNGEIFNLFGGLGMPTTVFLDADHNVVDVHSGVLDVDSLTEKITTDLLS